MALEALKRLGNEERGDPHGLERGVFFFFGGGAPEKRVGYVIMLFFYTDQMMSILYSKFKAFLVFFNCVSGFFFCIVQFIFVVGRHSLKNRSVQKHS